jgi:hypothetical protein
MLETAVSSSQSRVKSSSYSSHVLNDASQPSQAYPGETAAIHSAAHTHTEVDSSRERDEPLAASCSAQRRKQPSISSSSSSSSSSEDTEREQQTEKTQQLPPPFLKKK